MSMKASRASGAYDIVAAKSELPVSTYLRINKTVFFFFSDGALLRLFMRNWLQKHIRLKSPHLQ